MTILLTLLIAFFVYGSINFFLVYVFDSDEAYVKWTIGLGWIWYWLVNLLFAIPITAIRVLKYGAAVCVGSPYRYLIYTRNPIKLLAIKKYVSKKPYASCTWVYFVGIGEGEERKERLTAIKNKTYNDVPVLYK